MLPKATRYIYSMLQLSSASTFHSLYRTALKWNTSILFSKLKYLDLDRSDPKPNI